MKTKFDTQEFHKSMAYDIRFTAGRLNFGATRDHEHAAAVLISALTHLREYARHKALHPRDIQVAIEAALVGAEVEEVETRMGGTEFRKKVPE